MTTISAIYLTIFLISVLSYVAFHITKSHRHKKADKRLRAMMQEEVARSFSKKMSKLDKREARRLKAVRRDVAEVEE